MPVYRCATCDAPVSRPVAELTDQTYLRDSEREALGTTAGEADFVPEGFVLGTHLEPRPHPTFDGWPILNPDDCVETALEDAIGCCGPSEVDEPNTVCRNGHEVGNERGECYTTHYVALDPDSVIAADATERVTDALDDADPEAWLEVACSGSTSDRRRAIVLLGIEGTTEATDCLSDVATDGPESLRETAVRALGRIGSDDAIPALSTALTATESSTRAVAARALGEVGGERATAALLDRLVEESDATVCRAIGKGVGPEASLERLQKCLYRARSEPAMEASVGELAGVGGDEAADALAAVIADDDLPTGVRDQAVWLLARADTEQLDVDRLLVEAIDAVETASIRATCIGRLEYRDSLDAEATMRLYELLAEVRNDPDADDAVRSAARSYVEE